MEWTLWEESWKRPSLWGACSTDTMDGWTLALLASVPQSCDKGVHRRRGYTVRED